jgi:hypothetical protein
MSGLLAGWFDASVFGFDDCDDIVQHIYAILTSQEKLHGTETGSADRTQD